MFIRVLCLTLVAALAPLVAVGCATNEITSPSLNRTEKLSSCGVCGYQTGGKLNISSGVFSEMLNIQYTGNRNTTVNTIAIA